MKLTAIIVFAAVQFCFHNKESGTDKKQTLLALTGIYNASDCRTMASVYTTETSKFTCSYYRSTNTYNCTVVSPPTGNYIYNEKSVIEIKYSSVSDFINERRYVKNLKYKTYTCTGGCTTVCFSKYFSNSYCLFESKVNNSFDANGRILVRDNAVGKVKYSKWDQFGRPLAGESYASVNGIDSFVGQTVLTYDDVNHIYGTPDLPLEKYDFNMNLTDTYLKHPTLGLVSQKYSIEETQKICPLF
ncbi:MAG TPA: hypothetical protein PKA14_25530 [Leptospiraceae bacterium]|nr:hypothetical protein [Leptospiraceae bacterium]